MSAINTNLASLNAQRNLMTSESSLNTSIQRLSSGLRVNSAKDDAAGLSIATKMDSQIRGMSQATRNANDGISMAQTADGGLATAIDALQRMRELAVQGANGTVGTADAGNLDKEYQALASEVTRVAKDTKFNGNAILAKGGAAVDIQVGADVGQKITIGATDLESATVAGDVKTQGHVQHGASPRSTPHWQPSTPCAPTWAHRKTASATPSATCKARWKTSPPPRAASWTPTSRRKRRN